MHSDLDLSESRIVGAGEVQFERLPASDGEVMGMSIIALKAGEAVAPGQLVHLGDNGKWRPWTSEQGNPSERLTGIAVTGAKKGHALSVALSDSFVFNGAWAWQVSQPVYVGPDGGLSQSPETSGASAIGYAVAENVLMFRP